MIREFGIEDNKIYIIRHGVYNVIENPSFTKESARLRLKIEADSQLLLFFGNIAQYKGLNLLLESIRICEKEMPGLKLMMAGKVIKSYKREFDALLSNQNMDKILVRKEFIPEDEVELYFKAADVVVLPYEEGSQSGVLFLAYAYGRPVIASDVGSFKMDIREGETGLIFRKGDAQDLAQKIREWFAVYHPSALTRERNIKIFAQQEYSWDVIGKQIADIYRNVL